ncbi:MAG: VWA domain-containing protein [Acidobacteriota bacterium]
MIPQGAILRFAYPLVLLALLLPPALVVWQWRRGRRAFLMFSDLRLLAGLAPGWRCRLRRLPLILRGGALALLVVALARPQAENRLQEVLSEGVDIIVALDHSGSMAAVDLGRKPGGGFDPVSRLDFAQRVVGRFIQGRQADRIGLVTFAGRAFTRCPLTLDYGLLQQILDSVEITRRFDGTAIGMGLATAVNRLKNSPAKSRVVILLTDGRNNTGEIDPVTAARLARTMKVKVYTIGVGTEGVAPVPVDDPVFGPRYVYQPVDLDEKTLHQIADETEGRYFRATDARSLEEIFVRIDAMEKTEVKVHERVRRTELFLPFTMIAGLLLLLETGLSWTFLRTVP